MTSSSPSRAPVLAFTVSLLSLAIIGVPVFAETMPGVTISVAPLIDEYYAQPIVSQFAKVGALTSSNYDNATVERSSFDFAAYIADTCYRPTPFDMKSCREKYGPYADLNRTLKSGTLVAILKHYHLFKGTESVISEVQQQTQQHEVTLAIAQLPSPEQEYAQTREDRASHLWKICQRRYKSVQGANGCFQQNQRLITRFDVPVDANVR